MDTLVLGASGFVGPALLRALGRRGIGTSRRPGSSKLIEFDPHDQPLSALIERLPRRPSACVLLFGITNIDECARFPARTRSVNVDDAIRIIDDLRRLDIVPVYASSDAVFDGSKAGWAETDAAHPLVNYGVQKVEVERHLGAHGGPYLIVRLPKLVAAGVHPRCMMTGWIRSLAQQEELRCATDQFFSPAGVDDAAQAITSLIAAGARGIYHLGGPRRLSRRDYLETVAAEYARHAPLRARIIPCRLNDLGFPETRPLDTSLSSAKYAAEFPSHFKDVAQLARTAVAAYFAACPSS